MRTIVTEENLKAVLMDISKEPLVAVDTETTGLRPYNGDILFSIIVSTLDNDYYFNFNQYPDVEPLDESVFKRLGHILKDKEVVFHNAKFDLAMLANEGIVLEGGIHDVWAMDRVLFNDHFKYGLDAIAERHGYKKSEELEAYITKHKLWEWEVVPGTSRRRKNKFYNEVPFDVVSEYGLDDGRATIGSYKAIGDKLSEVSLATPDGVPDILQVVENEKRLVPTLYRMESTGIQADYEFCKEGDRFYREKIMAVQEEFEALTGHQFAKSPNLFKEIFADEKWQFTAKGNPSWDADVLKTFKHPAAHLVIDYSNCKKQLEYFEGFLYYMDKGGVIHTEFNQAGAATGRFSSKNPNLQNLTKPDKYDKSSDSKTEFPVRRAFIPRPGYFFLMIDYDQMEYRMMLDKARAVGLIEKVLGGLDVHQATADVASIDRYPAKTTNFSILYGAGLDSLAASLGVSKAKAKEIRDSVFRSAPEIRNFIRGVSRTAERRGFIFNWLGRRSYFTNPRFAYKAPNYLVQGGCADVVKVAMNRCDEYLQGLKSRMLLQIHDELVFEIHESEAHICRELQSIMEGVYPHEKLPLTCGAEFSFKSLADKQPLENLHLPHVEKAGDSIQGESAPHVGGASEQLGGENPAGIH